MKSEYKTADNLGRRKTNTMSVESNPNGFESLGIDNDMYFAQQTSLGNM